MDSRVSNIYLIAPVWESDERRIMGWERSDNKQNIEIIISPDDNTIRRLFTENESNSVHFFSGIHGFKPVFEYFKSSLKFNVRRGLISEPPVDYKIPLFLHKLRFLLYDYKYISKIDYIFGMGDKAVNYYRFWSKRWKVRLFGYCIDFKHITIVPKIHDSLELVYVGTLSKLKNVSLLLQVVNSLPKELNYHLDIIGNGPEYNNLASYIDKHKLENKVKLIGKLAMSDIHKKLSNYDILVMPSKRDGWGAVINEGLHSGLFIISSDNCGAKTLIENSNRGIIFKNNNIKSLKQAITYCIENADSINAEKIERIEWSEKINGASLAKYMVDCLMNDEVTMPPWKKNTL